MSENVTTLPITSSRYNMLVADCARCRIDFPSLLEAAKVKPEILPDPEPMTQEEVENWIMLKGQNPKDRWFEIRLLDDEVGQDPTAQALMETVSDMIFAGIHNMPFTEGQKVPKPDLNVVKPGGRSVKGT